MHNNMIKTPEYYLSLDLEKAKDVIPIEKEERIDSEIFCDVITAIYEKSKVEKIDVLKLKYYLGEPDRKEITQEYEVWEYDWNGTHDGNKFKSKTPYKIVDGIIVGLVKSA